MTTRAPKPLLALTFCLREGEHYAIIDGLVFGPWPSAAYAAAGLETELRRYRKKRTVYPDKLHITRPKLH